MSTIAVMEDAVLLKEYVAEIPKMLFENW